MDPAAYETYLKGWEATFITNAESFRSSLHHFAEARRLDPLMSEGWSGEARAHYMLANFYFEDPTDAMPLALEAAERALAIDSDDWNAWAIKGLYALYIDFDYAAAARFFA